MIYSCVDFTKFLIATNTVLGIWTFFWSFKIITNEFCLFGTNSLTKSALPQRFRWYYIFSMLQVQWIVIFFLVICNVCYVHDYSLALVEARILLTLNHSLCRIIYWLYLVIGNRILLPLSHSIHIISCCLVLWNVTKSWNAWARY